METFQNNLLSLSNCLRLEFHNFFFGVSSGDFVTKYPYNRLLFSLDSEGETIIADATETVNFERGMWLLIPAGHEARHAHVGSRHLSIHLSFYILRGIEILASLDKLLYGNNDHLIEIVETITASPEPLPFVSGIELLCRKILFEVLKNNPVDMEHFYAGFIKYAKLTKYLEQNCKCQVTVADMAKIMNMGEQSFAKKFSADTGISPKKFFNRLLASHAATLLVNTELSVKEIADEMEFCNEFYFSRFFKLHFGLSPSEFKQKMSWNRERCRFA